MGIKNRIFGICRSWPNPSFFKW